jgi:hypothetical protein
VKTTIYLDVDGVLNAVSKKHPSISATGWDKWETAPVNGWPILWSPELIAELNELAARDDVTFKWLTTWTDDAAKVLSPAIGINGQEWEVLHGDQHAWGGKRGWWKLEAIQKDILETMPGQFIWIDDDISAEREAIDWVTGRDNGYAISPFTSWGLTREHLTEIQALIDFDDKAAA